MRMRWNVLIDLIEKHHVARVVEVGVLKGNTANKVLSRFPNLIYLGIDPYRGYSQYYSEDDHANNKKEAQAVFSKYENSILFEGTSSDMIPDFKYDLVFIDGEHTYHGCKRDILHWKPHTNKILCGHDYGNGAFPGVKKAVDECLGVENIQRDSDHTWICQIN